jgi:hypothetical protein
MYGPTLGLLGHIADWSNRTLLWGPLQVVYEKCRRLTHGQTSGYPDDEIVNLNPDEHLSAMDLSYFQQVKTMKLQTKTSTFGPWGDLTSKAQNVVHGAIVGFFGCNHDGYITGIGVWTRDPTDPVPRLPEST